MESSLAVPETKRKRLIFAYDYMGRRIKKVVCGWSTSLGGYGPESLSYRYVYDGWNLVAELNRSRCIRTCTWGQDLSGSLQDAGGIGGLVFVRDWNSSNVGSIYPAYDGNGSLTALVRAEDGTLAASYEYSPYGELLTSTGDYARENPFRFSTKYTDGETGLAYFGYRYYNPDTGRWLNRDPIEEWGGNNLYSYVICRPTCYVDLLGLMDVVWPFNGGGGGIGGGFPGTGSYIINPHQTTPVAADPSVIEAGYGNYVIAVGAAGGVALGGGLLLPETPTWVLVTHWDTPAMLGRGLLPGQWVMVGKPGWWNYIFSGVGQWWPITKPIYWPSNYITGWVPYEYLRYPPGWEIIKAPLGQRVFCPGG